MRPLKARIVLGLLLLVFLALIVRQAYWKSDSISPLVGSASAMQPSGITGLPVGRCLPPANPADFSRILSTLVSYEKDLDENASPRDQTLCELAQIGFELGEAAKEGEKQQWYEKGAKYGELLIGEAPGRVEGYYWRAINLCGICEISRAAVALSMLPDIVHTLKTALNIDESYDQAGPARVLGRILAKAPPWPISEGDPGQSLVLLRLAVRIAPYNSTNHLYLAEALIDSGDSEEACRELSSALDAGCHAASSTQLKADKEQALALMVKCGPPKFGKVSAEQGKPMSVSDDPVQTLKD